MVSTTFFYAILCEQKLPDKNIFNKGRIRPWLLFVDYFFFIFTGQNEKLVSIMQMIDSLVWLDYSPCRGRVGDVAILEVAGAGVRKRNL